MSSLAIDGLQSASATRKYNYAPLRVDVKIFLRSLANAYWVIYAIHSLSMRVVAKRCRHDFLYNCGVIVFTLQAPRVHQNFSIKSASFNKSS